MWSVEEGGGGGATAGEGGHASAAQLGSALYARTAPLFLCRNLDRPDFGVRSPIYIYIYRMTLDSSSFLNIFCKSSEGLGASPCVEYRNPNFA